MKPTDPTAHYLRGTALARLGLRASALDAFQMVDTGSSVTVVSPRLAADLGIAAAADGRTIELDTLGGRTGGASAILASLRVGDLELREAPVVLRDPGFDVDGILGNTFLNRYRVTLDADQRQLQLRLLARD